MTREEADRIDNLRKDLGDWRVETYAAIKNAVAEHTTSCHRDCLVPMKDNVNWLVENAKRREHEDDLRRRLRRKWLTAIGIITPVAAVVVTTLGLTGVL